MKNIVKKQQVMIISQDSNQTRPISNRAALLCRLAAGSLLLASAPFALSQPAVPVAPANPPAAGIPAQGAADRARHARHEGHRHHHHHAHHAAADARDGRHAEHMGMQPHAGAHAGMRGREHVALFSQDERQQFRTRMHEARSPEERRAIREEMHQQYRQRAAANPALTPPANPAASPSAPAIPGG